jgi:4-hydroxybenzoate polyprenyltransferase
VSHILRGCFWDLLKDYRALAVLATFAGSGLLHAIPVAFAGVPRDCVLLVFSFFMLQAIGLGVDVWMMMQQDAAQAAAKKRHHPVKNGRRWQALRYALSCFCIFGLWPLFLSHPLIMAHYELGRAESGG